MSVAEEVSMTVESNSRLSNISIDNLSGPGNASSKLDYGNYSTCLESRDNFLHNKRAILKQEDTGNADPITKPEATEKMKGKTGPVNEKLPVGNSTIYFYKQFNTTCK